ncbi:ATP-binding protein [Marinoscillum sp. MHG1-6]|uniref:ATP-binding protein n=1 Tax=Marinoscillum sp. MHG1-6 TaxID=2959627 RepID=UPI0021581282|nr:ATP-binding protein [Marinoscillum sp. MHG1-6]
MHFTISPRIFNTTSVVGGVIMLVYAISTLIATISLQDASRKNELEEIAKNFRAHQHYLDEVLEGGFAEISCIQSSVEQFQVSDKRLVSRDLVNHLLKSVTRNNPAFLGFWMVWEPQAFDSLDHIHTSGNGTNGDGRYVPYWHWDEDTVVVESCILFEVHDYYQLPKKNHLPYLLDPFYYPVGGENELLVSIVRPILREGTFLGVVGADLSLNSLSEFVKRVAEIEKGHASLIGGDGTYVVNDEPENIGKSDSISTYLMKTATRHSMDSIRIEKIVDEFVFTANIGGKYAESPWLFTLKVPEEVINEDFISLRANLLVLSAISALIIGFLLVYNVVQRIESDEERTKVRGELSSADARITSFIEGGDTPASIYSLDNEFRYTGFNSIHKKEMLEQFGAEVEEGKYMPDLVPDHMEEHLVKNLKRAIRGEQFSVTNMFGDRYYTQTFNPVYGQTSEVVGLTSSVVDVTSRIKAEQELEQYRDQLEELVEERTQELTAQKEFLQRIIDEISAVIFVRDEDGKYILVNKKAADSFGLPINDIVGKSVNETHVSAKEAERFLNEDRELLSKGGMLQDETFFTWPENNSKSWLLLTKMRIFLNDRPHILGVHVDVTHLKETEMKLMAANKELHTTLENLKSTQLRLVESEKMASIGQLSAGLAHEINNPINYVAGNLYPIRRDLEEVKSLIIEEANNWGAGGKHLVRRVEELFVEIENLMDAVNEGTSRVSNLVGDLRAFARPGEMNEQGPLDINICIKSTVNLVRHQPEKYIQFELELDELPPINGTDRQFKQVCLNILSNACQAIKKKGIITVRAFKEEEKIKIHFIDTGSGIHKDHLGRIFEPFFTTKDVGEGTGLGLAISYNLMKDLGGNISVLSTSSRGTTFELILPLPT